MSSPVRRLFPPPRRRPNPFVVAGRWWLEIVLGAVAVLVAVASVQQLGPVGAVALAMLVLVGVVGAAVGSEEFREAFLGAYQRLIVPHRARQGIVHAGVANRLGRLPTIVRSRCRADQARLWLHLPAGLIAEDLVAARHVIAASCGAAEVLVLPDGPRRDRVLMVVVRPRWGWPAG